MNLQYLSIWYCTETLVMFKQIRLLFFFSLFWRHVALSTQKLDIQSMEDYKLVVLSHLDSILIDIDRINTLWWNFFGTNSFIFGGFSQRIGWKTLDVSHVWKSKCVFLILICNFYFYNNYYMISSWLQTSNPQNDNKNAWSFAIWYEIGSCNNNWSI